MKKLISLLLSILTVVLCCAFPCSAFAASGVAINAQNFPDTAFRGIVENYDKNNDQKLSSKEAKSVTKMDISSKNIKNLKGIGYFVNLKKLDCSKNKITEMNLSKNRKLESLNCSENKLSALSVKKNTKLISLDCSSNKLTALNVSKNTKLKTLECTGNKISVLNVKKNKKLVDLLCHYNKIKSLDIRSNTYLYRVNCSFNPITVIKIGTHKKMKLFDAHNCPITEISLQGLPALTFLDVRFTKLVNLDVSKNVNLDCIRADVKNYVDISNLSKLRVCDIYLEPIYVSNFTKEPDGDILVPDSVWRYKDKGLKYQRYFGKEWHSLIGIPLYTQSYKMGFTKEMYTEYFKDNNYHNILSLGWKTGHILTGGTEAEEVQPLYFNFKNCR